MAARLFVALTLAAVAAALLQAPPPAEAQAATLLVSNTGQTTTEDHRQVVSAGDPRAAQQFTTGTENGGYTIGSVGVNFAAIGDTSTAAADLQVTLNSVDTVLGGPGAALCTLSDPGTFSDSGIQTFQVPTTCPTLTKETDYFVVVEHVDANSTKTYTLEATSSALEDDGTATGWSIANEYKQWLSPFWVPFTGRSFLIELRSAAAEASNADPAFSAETATRTLPENSGAGVNVAGGTITATDSDSDTLTYSLTGTDAGSFEIDSSGQLTTKAGATHNFNFEAAKNSYSVTVNVRDSKDAAGAADIDVDDTIAVTINLTNVNEAPEITTTATTADVPENSTAVLTLAASDEDASDTHTWSVETADDGSFFEITQGGVLSFTDAPDFETKQDADTDNIYDVTVKVADAGALSDTHAISVTVTGVNEAPEITTTATTADVPENSTAVLTLAASDEDASDTHTWSVETTGDGSFFEITQAGVLSFKNAPDFENEQDADTDNVYVVTVKVADAGGLSDTHTISVTVTDVNEASEIDLCDRTAEVETALLAAVAATDCALVPRSQLAAITTLDLSSQSISALQADDFAGLTGLTTLDLADNALTTLPAGLFTPLTSLTALDLRDNTGLSYSPYLLSVLTSLATLDGTTYTRPAVAAAPTNLTATFVGGNIELSWTAPATGVDQQLPDPAQGGRRRRGGVRRGQLRPGRGRPVHDLPRHRRHRIGDLRVPPARAERGWGRPRVRRRHGARRPRPQRAVSREPSRGERLPGSQLQRRSGEAEPGLVADGRRRR